MVEGYDGQSFVRGGRRRILTAGLARLQTTADVRLSYDRSFRAEHNVAACMVSVPMCVQHELQLALAYRAERGANPICERRELVVNYQYSVRANGDAYVAARALKHVDVPGYLRHRYLHARKISLRESFWGEEQNER